MAVHAVGRLMTASMLLVVGITAQSLVRPKIVCYYTTWSSQRPNTKMFVSDIDPNLCTHAVLAFANINSGTFNLEPSSWDDIKSGENFGRYNKFNHLKLENNRLVTMLSIGGEKERSTKLKIVSESPASRVAFSENVVKYLHEHNFNGLDIDWEFPKADDHTKEKFTLLLKTIQSEFKSYTRRTGQRRFELSIAAGVGRNQIDDGYEVQNISRYVDFINLMTYDYSGPWSKLASHNSPLYPRVHDSRFNQELCQEWSVNYWIERGAPPEKLVLGISTSAKVFKLANISNNAVGAPISGSGSMGLLQIGGTLTYSEICEVLRLGATEVWDDVQKVPYVHWGTQWASYDNTTSIRIKAEWLLNKTLGGAMVWLLDYDDFKGDTCNEGRFPLTSTIKTVFDEYVSREASSTIARSRRPRATAISTTTKDTSGAIDDTSGAIDDVKRNTIYVALSCYCIYCYLNMRF